MRDGQGGYQQVTVKVHKEASVKELIEAVAEKVGGRRERCESM